MSSTNLSQMWGVVDSAKGFDLKLLHEQVGNEGADGDPWCTMYLFIILTPEEEVCVFKTELQKGNDMWDGHAGPVW